MRSLCNYIVSEAKPKTLRNCIKAEELSSFKYFISKAYLGF